MEGGGAEACRLLPISELNLSLVGRARAGVSEEVVEDYADHLGALPPVRVALTEEDRYVVVGGLHRIRAHERAGRAEVACTVERMGRAEAVLAAVADNRAHGARMTRADTRAVIGLLLAEAGDLSSRDIADMVGCSHHTVEEVRSRGGQFAHLPAAEGRAARQDPVGSVRPLPETRRATTRKGRDGKAYRPKARPKREPAAAVVPPPPAAPRPAAPAPRLGPPPVGSPAWLMDFRRGVPWVAQFLRLRTTRPTASTGTRPSSSCARPSSPGSFASWRPGPRGRPPPPSPRRARRGRDRQRASVRGIARRVSGCALR